jgi:hypothetical protein
LPGNAMKSHSLCVVPVAKMKLLLNGIASSFSDNVDVARREHSAATA